MNSICRLSQLKQLEAESIHIFRDAISQFEQNQLLPLRQIRNAVTHSL